MFNSKEISRKALLRAYEIKNQKKARKKQTKIFTAIFTTCVTAAVVIMVNISPAVYSPDEYILMGDNEIPLGAFQFPPDDEISIFDFEDDSLYRTFEIVLADTGETLYISDMLALSPACAEKIEMIKALSEISRKATLIIRSYDPDTLAEIGGAEIAFDFILK